MRLCLGSPVPSLGFFRRNTCVANRTCLLLEGLRAISTASCSFFHVALSYASSTILAFNRTAVPHEIPHFLLKGLLFSVTIFKHHEFASKLAKGFCKHFLFHLVRGSRFFVYRIMHRWLREWWVFCWHLSDRSIGWVSLHVFCGVWFFFLVTFFIIWVGNGNQDALLWVVSRYLNIGWG